MMVPVKFLTGFDKYNAGEVAGFKEELARSYIVKRIAIPYEETKQEAKAVEPVSVEPEKESVDQEKKRGKKSKE